MNRETNSLLSFEDWESEVHDELVCLFAETGADQELDFDWESAATTEYEKYLKTGYLLTQPYSDMAQENLGVGNEI